MSFIIILIIAVSLSMDAFSLSLAYGTLKLEKKQIITLSLIVSIYHFIMPQIGRLIGNLIFSFVPISPSLIVFIILCFIGIQMILESNKEENNLNIMSFKNLLIFGFAVSLDSFSVGISLKAISSKYLLCSIIFSVTSFIFTYLGLYLGKKISLLIGKTATKIGGIILILIGLIYLVK